MYKMIAVKMPLPDLIVLPLDGLIKPLAYHIEDRVFAFADELKPKIDEYGNSVHELSLYWLSGMLKRFYNIRVLEESDRYMSLETAMVLDDLPTYLIKNFANLINTNLNGYTMDVIDVTLIHDVLYLKGILKCQTI